MDNNEHFQFIATTGNFHGIGATPELALAALRTKLQSEFPTPIVIWHHQSGDELFTSSQHQRLAELAGRRETLAEEEVQEFDKLMTASFDAAVARINS